MALVVYSIINVLDPKRIFFGGSVAYRNPIYIELLKDELEKFLVVDQRHIIESITVSNLRVDYGINGAGLTIHPT